MKWYMKASVDLHIWLLFLLLRIVSGNLWWENMENSRLFLWNEHVRGHVCWGPTLSWSGLVHRFCWCNSHKKIVLLESNLEPCHCMCSDFRPSCFYESTLICFKVSLKSGSWPSFGVSWHWLLLSSDFASLVSPHCWGLDIEYVEYVDIYANVTYLPIGRSHLQSCKGDDAGFHKHPQDISGSLKICHPGHHPLIHHFHSDKHAIWGGMLHFQTHPIYCWLYNVVYICYIFVIHVIIFPYCTFPEIHIQ